MRARGPTWAMTSWEEAKLSPAAMAALHSRFLGARVYLPRALRGKNDADEILHYL